MSGGREWVGTHEQTQGPSLSYFPFHFPDEVVCRYEPLVRHELSPFHLPFPTTLIPSNPSGFMPDSSGDPVPFVMVRCRKRLVLGGSRKAVEEQFVDVPGREWRVETGTKRGEVGVAGE